jgi:hypothetical protein
MRRRSTQRGQGLVEFALVIPVFLLILFGLIDGGRYVFMNNALSQAAREGARVAAAEARWIGNPTGDPGCVASEAGITAINPGAHVCPVNVVALKDHITAAANRMVAPFGSVKNVAINCQPVGTPPAANWVDTGCPAANRTASKSAVWVRVELTFIPITPVIGQAWTMTTSGSATMVVN